MKKAYFIDYSGSVSSSVLSSMATMGLALQTAGHEVYFLDSAGPKVATKEDLLHPGLLRGGGTPSILDPFYLAMGQDSDPSKHWEYIKVSRSWDTYEVSFLTDGDVLPSLLICFDNVLVFSTPKADLVHDVMTA